MDNEIEWTCENTQCDDYEISLSYPVEVLSPNCPDCGEQLVKE